MKTILIIEDDVIYARSIGNWLRKQEMGSERVTTLSAARKSLSDREYDLVLADLRLPDGNSTDLLRWMHDRHIATPFLIMTNYGQVENAVEAMRLGAARNISLSSCTNRAAEGTDRTSRWTADPFRKIWLPPSCSATVRGRSRARRATRSVCCRRPTGARCSLTR